MGPTSLLLMSSSLICVTLQVRVSPNQSKFFRGQSVSFRCEDLGWTVRRNTSTDTRGQCGVAWGRLSGPWCEIKPLWSRDRGLHRRDSGRYWCESREGQTSDSIHISVTDRGAILQVPVLPVTEGQTVSLSCRHHTSSNFTARFHRDGHFLWEVPTGHMTLQQMSASDEGLYQCEIRGETSESSWLRVIPGKAPPPTPETLPPSAETPPPASERPLALALLCHLVVLCPYVVSTVLMVSLYRQTLSGSEAPVAADTAPPPRAQDDDITGVTTEYNF